jgi:hypothetical protein
MKQRIWSHFQDYLIQYISHQYQDLLLSKDNTLIKVSIHTNQNPTNSLRKVLISHDITLLKYWYMTAWVWVSLCLNWPKPGCASTTCSTISNIPYNLIFTTKFNDSSILITYDCSGRLGFIWRHWTIDHGGKYFHNIK